MGKEKYKRQGPPSSPKVDSMVTSKGFLEWTSPCAVEHEITSGAAHMILTAALRLQSVLALCRDLLINLVTAPGVNSSEFAPTDVPVGSGITVWQSRKMRTRP